MSESRAFATLTDVVDVISCTYIRNTSGAIVKYGSGIQHPCAVNDPFPSHLPQVLEVCCGQVITAVVGGSHAYPTHTEEVFY